VHIRLICTLLGLRPYRCSECDLLFLAPYEKKRRHG